MKKIIILSVLSLALGPISYMANAMVPSADSEAAAVDVMSTSSIPAPTVINLCPPNFCPFIPVDAQAEDLEVEVPTPAPHPCTPSLFLDTVALPCIPGPINPPVVDPCNLNPNVLQVDMTPDAVVINPCAVDPVIEEPTPAPHPCTPALFHDAVLPCIASPIHPIVIGPCDLNPNVPQIDVIEADAVATPCAVDPVIEEVTPPPHPCTPALFHDAVLPCIPGPIHFPTIDPCDLNPNVPQIDVIDADSVATPCAVDPIIEEEENGGGGGGSTPPPSGGGGGGGGFIPTNVTNTPPPTPPTSPSNGDDDQQVLGEQIFADNGSNNFGSNNEQQVLGEQQVAAPSFPKTGTGASATTAISLAFLTSLVIGAALLSRKQKVSSIFLR